MKKYFVMAFGQDFSVEKEEVVSYGNAAHQCVLQEYGIISAVG